MAPRSFFKTLRVLLLQRAAYRSFGLAAQAVASGGGARGRNAATLGQYLAQMRAHDGVGAAAGNASAPFLFDNGEGSVGERLLGDVSVPGALSEEGGMRHVALTLAPSGAPPPAAPTMEAERTLLCKFGRCIVSVRL